MFVGTIEHKCSYIAKKSIASVSRDAIKTFGELLSIHGGFFWLHKRSPPEEIKKAYYNCMKACHPNLSGNDPETTNFCMFINEVYAVLSDPVQRMIYDEIHGYALTAINPFLDDSCMKDLAFVDEFSCIGCKNCANVAPDVFSIEEDFGRARVAMMLSGMNISAVDVFRMASSRWQKRQAKVLLLLSLSFLSYIIVYWEALNAPEESLGSIRCRAKVWRCDNASVIPRRARPSVVLPSLVS
ncbi:hypothetical protein UlMin_019397 [Ulmus minor]